MPLRRLPSGRTSGLLLAIAAQTSLDLLHFSLHPLNSVRLSVAFGLVLLHAAVLWGAALVLRLPAIWWRAPRSIALSVIRLVAATAGAGVMVAVAAAHAGRRSGDRRSSAALAASAMHGAVRSRRPRGRTASRVSGGSRSACAFLALVIPALAMYPSLHAFAAQSKEALVADASRAAGRQASARISRPQRCRTRSKRSTPCPALAEFVDDLVGRCRADDRSRVHRLVADRARDLPDDVGRRALRTERPPRQPLRAEPARIRHDAPIAAAGCDDWDLYEEASPFGSSAAARACAPAARSATTAAGSARSSCARCSTIGSLPFISSREPVPRVAAAAIAGAVPRTTSARDVEFAVYGWSRAPIYASGHERLAAARRRLRPDGRVARAVLGARSSATARRSACTSSTTAAASTRSAIRSSRGSATSSISPSWSSWPACCTLALLAGGDAVQRADVAHARRAAARCCARSARASIASCSSPSSRRRSCRSSFSRSRRARYFANQFRAGVEEAAVKTATVAQRLVEDYAALQQRGAESLDVLDDQIMVLVRRAIDQDVNLFDRARLQATSERDLFASRLLPRARPATSTAASCSTGCRRASASRRSAACRYLLAAAPVRTGGREGIVTVPQPLRQPGDRAADRRARPAGAVGVGAVRAARRRRSATGWPSASPTR